MAKTKEEFLKQLAMEKEALENASKGVKDIGGGIKARLLEDIDKDIVLNKDAMLSPADRAKKRFADMAKVRRETGSTGIPEYDRVLTEEGEDIVQKARTLDPANKFETYPKAPETEVDYMKKARKVAEDMEKSDPERVAREKAARGKELMEKSKESGRQMNRKAWAKDPDVGNEFVMRNKSIMDTPEATVRAMKGSGKEGALKSLLKKFGKKSLKAIPLIGAGMMAGDLYAAGEDISEGATLSEAAKEFAEKQSPIPTELLKRPIDDISSKLEELDKVRDKALIEEGEDIGDLGYANSQARKDKIRAILNSDKSLGEDVVDVRRLSSAEKGRETLEEGVQERDPEMEAKMRDILADPEAMLLKNPDRKREAAKNARRRLAEEMMKRRILPKVRE